MKYNGARLYQFLLVLILICITSTTVYAAGESNNENVEDYLELSLQDLLSVEVTSVSKIQQNLREVATAIYVITSDDIRRSGATTLPELLRNVPGINVAQIDGYSWAISARGFNGLRANKLLVLLDGRSIYTPFYGGVFWDAQDTLFEDIERIEVIRGPGGTIWGANAVNGVINIITSHAADTQGSFINASSGNEVYSNLSARHGNKVNNNTHYRVYAKQHTHDGSINENGDDAKDGINFLQSGFRLDHQYTNSNTLNIHGDAYQADRELYSSVALPFAPFGLTAEIEEISGANLMATWTAQLDNDDQFKFHVYFDQAKRSSDILTDKITTIDAEFQYQLPPIGNHSLVWGGSYRYVKDEFSGVFTIDMRGDKREDDLFSTYLQDEISLPTYNMKITVGTKVERNDYSGTEVQPNLRMVWTPNDRHSYWGAISRAVHTPTRFAHDGQVNIYIPAQNPMIISVQGNRELDSEELTAYEAGWRSQINERLSFDLALFYNEYDQLRGKSPGTPYFSNGAMVIPTFYDNNLEGSSHGLELSAFWHASDRWQLTSNYSYLKVLLDSKINSASDEELEDRSPEHQFNIMSDISLTPNTDLNLSLRYNSKILNVSEYTAIDANVIWRFDHNLEFHFTGRNLFDQKHPEFASEQSSQIPKELERSFYTGVRWNF